jgi:hypothetical protein
MSRTTAEKAKLVVKTALSFLLSVRGTPRFLLFSFISQTLSVMIYSEISEISDILLFHVLPLISRVLLIFLACPNSTHTSLSYFSNIFSR